MSNQLTSEEIRAMILSTGEGVRKQFLKYFGAEVESFVSNLARVYDRMQEMATRVNHDRRSAWAYEFLFAAFNSLLTSFALLISGFHVAAGNLMRHHGEAIVTALLLSHRQIGTFAAVDNDLRKFSVHKALDLVKKKRNTRLLGIDRQGWQKFQELISFYDQYSHPPSSQFRAVTVSPSPAIGK
jgi:hypothetical protein